MRAAPLVLALACAVGVGVAASACDVPAGGSRRKVAKSERCMSCHMGEFEAAHSGRGPTACAVCHVQTHWRPMHDEDLAHAWKLEGAHLRANCYACHRDDRTPSGDAYRWEGTPTTCVGCHEKDRADADAKLEWHRDFETTCASCHTADAWKPANHDEPPPAASSTPPPLDSTPPPPSASSSSSSPPAASASVSAAVPTPRPTWTPPTNWPPQPSVDIVTRPSPRRR